MDKRIKALLWDFDGTLAETHVKNHRVTVEIVRELVGKSAHEVPSLRTVESYGVAHRLASNWREFYMTDLGLTEEQIDEAGRLWTEYQLRDEAPIPIYDGIGHVLKALHGLPHGVVSQNSRSTIRNTLAAAGLLKYFACIIGYEEVDIRRQKPAPDGLVQCIEALTALEPGVVFYVGDHDVDIETAHNANEVFNRRGMEVRVVTIAAAYGLHVDHSEWQPRPDFVAGSAVEIVDILRRFEGDQSVSRQNRSGSPKLP